jgi:hypothetical protein
LSSRDPQLVSALRSTIIVQLVTLLPVLLTEGVSDLLYVVAGCTAIFWLTASALMWKRSVPGKGRMIFLRYGYIIMLVLATPFWIGLLQPWLAGPATASVAIEAPAGQVQTPAAQPVETKILTDRDANDEFFAKLLGTQSLNDFQKTAGLPLTNRLNADAETALLKQAGYTMLEEKEAPLKLVLAYDAATRELVVRLTNAGPRPLRLANNRLALDSDQASFALEAIIRLADAKTGERIETAGALITTRLVNQLPVDFGDRPVLPAGATLAWRQKLPAGKSAPIATDINSCLAVQPEPKQVFRIPAASWTPAN